MSPASLHARTLLLAAIGLTAAAVANHLVARRTERRHPPSGEFIEIDGVRLHYLDHGPDNDATPIVLLHGNGASSDDFAIAGLVEALAAEHRIVVFDRPGFGHSTRPRATAWTASAQAALLHGALQQLGVHRPVLVGHSWGTLVALAMALDNPQPAGLVLVSGFYQPEPRMDVAVFSGPAFPVLGDLFRHTIAPALGWLMSGAVFRHVFAPSPVTPGFAARFPTGMALRPSQIRASAADTALMIPSAAALEPRYGDLRLPVTILAGTGDRIVDFGRHSRRLHATIKGSRLIAIEGVGHMAHHNATFEVLQAIREQVWNLAQTPLHLQASGERSGTHPFNKGPRTALVEPGTDKF